MTSAVTESPGIPKTRVGTQAPERALLLAAVASPTHTARDADWSVAELWSTGTVYGSYTEEPYDGLPLEKYFSPEVVLPAFSSRGCYWRRCTFCARPDRRGFSQRRSTTRVSMRR